MVSVTGPTSSDSAGGPSLTPSEEEGSGTGRRPPTGRSGQSRKDAPTESRARGWANISRGPPPDGSSGSDNIRVAEAIPRELSGSGDEVVEPGQDGFDDAVEGVPLGDGRRLGHGEA